MKLLRRFAIPAFSSHWLTSLTFQNFVGFAYHGMVGLSTSTFTCKNKEMQFLMFFRFVASSTVIFTFREVRSRNINCFFRIQGHLHKRSCQSCQFLIQLANRILFGVCHNLNSVPSEDSTVSPKKKVINYFAVVGVSLSDRIRKEDSYLYMHYYLFKSLLTHVLY